MGSVRTWYIATYGDRFFYNPPCVISSLPFPRILGLHTNVESRKQRMVSPFHSPRADLSPPLHHLGHPGSAPQRPTHPARAARVWTRDEPNYVYVPCGDAELGRAECGAEGIGRAGRHVWGLWCSWYVGLFLLFVFSFCR